MGYPEGVRSTPSLFSRGGTLLPSIYADARYIDAVVVAPGKSTTVQLSNQSAQDAVWKLTKGFAIRQYSPSGIQYTNTTEL